MAEMKLTRNVEIAECPWLDRAYKAGETVHRYQGYTYGCISPNGIACTEAPDETPFFELPAGALSASPTNERTTRG